MMTKNDIPPLVTFVTDRELALMNTIDNLFPSSGYILCIWHINMNILAIYRKHFPKDKQVAHQIIPDPRWELFLKD
jgi:MULE transposase domain